jgi:hypothetical protein
VSHNLAPLFPFTYTINADDVGAELAKFEAKLAALRAELHQRMKWRARYGYSYSILAQPRRSIAMYDGWVRNGRAKLRQMAARPIEWKAAA